MFREPKHRNIFAILTLYVLRRCVPSAGGCHCVDGLFCSIMLEISLTLSRRDCIYEDMASKFFEHFVAIADAINQKDGIGKSPSL